MKYCFNCMNTMDEQANFCENCGKAPEIPADTHQLVPGTKLHGKYLIGRVLGEGGFGITYIGVDLVLGMRVAVKEYYPHGYSNRNHNESNRVTLSKSSSTDFYEKGMERFLQEATTLAKFCDEPGVVGVRDFFQENGTAYIVMDYLDGVTLKAYLHAKGVFPVQGLLELMEPVLRVLEKIHQQNLIHRDISPDNIMLLRNGQLKLLDFGAAREMETNRSLSVMLKPGYAPEEQYRSKGVQGPWTDIYALCATIYKCITGVTPEESLERISDDDLKFPSQLGVQITPDQEQAIMKGLQVRAADRWQSVRELADALYGNHKSAEKISSVDVSLMRDENADEEELTTPGEGQDSGKTHHSEEKVEEGSEERTTIDPDVGNKKKNKGKNSDQVEREDRKTNGGQNGRKKKLILLAAAVAILVVVFTCVRLISNFVREPISKTTGTGGYELTALWTDASDPDRQLRFDIPLALQKLGYQEAEYLGEDLWVARIEGDGINTMGLYRTDGTCLIQPKAALIQWPENVEDPSQLMLEAETNCRYLKVYWAQSVTTDKNEALLWQGNVEVYPSPLDNAVMHTGYYRVYDLQEQRFVGDLISRTGYRAMMVCADLFCIQDSGRVYLYNADGEIVLDVMGEATVGNGCILVQNGGTYYVYDENGNNTYTSNTYIRLCGDYTRYLVYDPDECYLLNLQGERILEESFDQIGQLYQDTLIVQKDGKYGLIRLDGSWVVPCQYKYIRYIGSGYFDATTPGGTHTAIGPEGIVATKEKYSTYYMVLKKNGNFLVVNEHTFSLDLSQLKPRELVEGVVSVEDPVTGMKGVYDLFTGQRLLDTVYETVQYNAGCLYAYRNGTWEAYRLNFTT